MLTHAQEDNGKNDSIVCASVRLRKPLSKLRDRFAFVVEDVWPHFPTSKLRVRCNDLSSSSEHCYHSMKQVFMDRHRSKQLFPAVDATIRLIDDLNGWK